jgi:YD repeat-containing protein
MKYFFFLAMVILSLSMEPILVNAQPITQTERNAGLEQRINRYIYSETYTGSDTAWIQTNTRTQTFNGSNQLDIFEQEKIDSNGTQKENKWEHTYTGGLLTLLNVYNWKDENWELGSKTEIGYDEFQRQVSNTNYFKNDSGEILIGTITLMSYDANGRVSEVTSYRNQGIMPDTTKQVNTYDADGNLIELLNQKFKNGNWANQNITAFFYKDGKYLGQEYKFWYGPELLPDYMDSILYDAQDRRISRLHYKSYDDAYELDYRYVWAYDDSNRVSEEIYQDWEGVNWGDSSKITFTYDERGNLTERHKQQLRSDEWTEKEMTYISYNEYNYVTDFQFYIWLVNDWLRNTRLTYEYGEIGVNDVKNYQNNLNNYPNPFSFETTISFDLKVAGNVNITIYNINGQVLKTENLRGLSTREQQYRFNSGNLPSGIYIYSVDNGKEKYFNSFVISK